jgi:hypothetical protein
MATPTVVTPAAVLGDAAWTVVGVGAGPAFQNSFVAASTDAHQQGPRFRKDALGFVHLQGSFTNGSNAAVVFTLPAGYRPGGLFYCTQFDTSQNGDIRYVRIDTDGTVKFWGANPTVRNTSLDGYSFFAEN